ncbi:MAG: hypothetical protein PVI75_01270 [Gammaproteobacteria bacterium]|jgi:hypothetical protein
MQTIHAILLSICSFFHPPIHVNMTPATSIVGLPRAIAKVKKKSTLPILFPKQVPVDPEIKTYYASTSLTNIPLGINYIINVDRTKKCNGAHYCNIGMLQAESKANPQMYYDRNHQEITVPVKLDKDFKGYFTPSHAMGDFWPAMLQWRNNGTLYTLSWNVNPQAKEKYALIKMANSIIAQEK